MRSEPRRSEEFPRRMRDSDYHRRVIRRLEVAAQAKYVRENPPHVVSDGRWWIDEETGDLVRPWSTFDRIADAGASIDGYLLVSAAEAFDRVGARRVRPIARST